MNTPRPRVSVFRYSRAQNIRRRWEVVLVDGADDFARDTDEGIAVGRFVEESEARAFAARLRTTIKARYSHVGRCGDACEHRRCTKKKGHGGPWHDDGHACWARQTEKERADGSR